jgi:hypothetical protein
MVMVFAIVAAIVATVAPDAAAGNRDRQGYWQRQYYGGPEQWPQHRSYDYGRYAQREYYYPRQRQYQYQSGQDWVGPFVVGAVLGYAIGQQQQRQYYGGYQYYPQSSYHTSYQYPVVYHQPVCRQQRVWDSYGGYGARGTRCR